MRARRAQLDCRCKSRAFLLSTPLLFLSIILPAPSYAQHANDATSTTQALPEQEQDEVCIDCYNDFVTCKRVCNGNSSCNLTCRAKLCDEGICNQRCSNLDICVTGPSVTTPISSISASLATTRPPSSLVTSFSSTAANSTTTSSSVPTRAMDPPGGIPLSNPHSGQYNADQETKEGVFNYYFLFLALFGVVVAVFLWWIHRRKKRRKEQLRLSGQNALARDLDGWVNTRRWMHGGWRHNHTAAFVRREEGLDERGEAPPPYEPKADTAGGQGDAQPVQDSASELTVPLRTLQRDDIERSRPPEYQESVHRSESETVRPDAANTRIT